MNSITMVDIGCNGRLGNQMFQWAALRALSVKYNLPIELIIHRGDFRSTFRLDELFDLPFKKINTDNIIPSHNITESGFCYNQIGINNPKGIINIKGYFQSYKYFSEISEIIRQDFKFKKDLQLRCEDHLRNFKKQGYITVSIHIRRGDYLEPNHSFAYNCVGKEYCEKAIRYLKDRLPSENLLQIIYFSDDIEWCKKNLPQKDLSVTFSQYSDIEDICLMSMCDHNIIGPSTFSWWAAWLNKNPNKIIISPKCWFTRHFERQIGYVEEDLFPKDWILI